MMALLLRRFFGLVSRSRLGRRLGRLLPGGLRLRQLGELAHDRHHHRPRVAAQVVGAGQGDAGGERRRQRRAEAGGLLAAAVDAEQRLAPQLRGLGQHRPVLAAAMAQPLAEPELEAGRAPRTEQGDQAHLALQVGRQPSDHERQHLGAQRVTDEQGVLALPGGEIGPQDPRQVGGGALRRPRGPEVLQGVEAHHREAAFGQLAGHVPVEPGPAAVARDHHRQRVAGRARLRQLEERQVAERPAHHGLGRPGQLGGIQDPQVRLLQAGAGTQLGRRLPAAAALRRRDDRRALDLGGESLRRLSRQGGAAPRPAAPARHRGRQQPGLIEARDRLQLVGAAARQRLRGEAASGAQRMAGLDLRTEAEADRAGEAAARRLGQRAVSERGAGAEAGQHRRRVDRQLELLLHQLAQHLEVAGRIGAVLGQALHLAQVIGQVEADDQRVERLQAARQRLGLGVPAVLAGDQHDDPPRGPGAAVDGDLPEAAVGLVLDGTGGGRCRCRRSHGGGEGGGGSRDGRRRGEGGDRGDSSQGGRGESGDGARTAVSLIAPASLWARYQSPRPLPPQPLAQREAGAIKDTAERTVHWRAAAGCASRRMRSASAA